MVLRAIRMVKLPEYFVLGYGAVIASRLSFVVTGLDFFSGNNR